MSIKIKNEIQRAIRDFAVLTWCDLHLGIFGNNRAETCILLLLERNKKTLEGVTAKEIIERIKEEKRNNTPW